MSIFLLIATCLLFERCASKAAFAQSCVSGDAECFIKANTRAALASIGNGIPELDIAPLEPMNLRNITVDQGLFKLVFPDMKIMGAKRCKVENMQLNSIQSTMSVTLDCPLESTGAYRFTGKLYPFEVNHDGDYKIKTDSIKTTIITKVDTINGLDGNKYWKLTDYEYSYEPMKTLDLNLDNMFVGSINTVSPFLSVLGNKWWPMVAKVADPAADAAVGRFHDVWKSLFLRVPLEQLSK